MAPLPDNLATWRDLALDHDDRSVGIRRVIAELLLDLAAGTSDAWARGYLQGLAHGLVKFTPARGEVPSEIQ